MSEEDATREAWTGLCAHGYEHGERGMIHTEKGWERIGSPFIADAELDKLAERWRKAYRPRDIRPLTPLPRRVRLRLWRERQVDAIGAWLCGHHAGWAAIALWQAFGMWQD